MKQLFNTDCQFDTLVSRHFVALKGFLVPVVKSPPLNGANRFAHIDAMRAFAVMLVVVAHAGLGGFVPGGSGVTIFFSISGFIITYLLLRERDKTGGFSVKAFYLRRAVKILPPLLLIVVIPSFFLIHIGEVDVMSLLSQVFFVFNWAYISGDTHVLVGSDVVWSLAIEEQFYILFAIVWLLVVQSSRWRLLISGVAVGGILYSTIARLVMATGPSISDRIYYGSDTRMDGIAWGVLAAVAFHWLQRDGQLNSRVGKCLARDWIFITALSLYLFSLIYRDELFRDTLRYTLQSIAACVVILYGLLPGSGPVRRIFYRASQWPVVSLIGLASYSIYLIHLVLMNALRSWLDLPMQPISVILLTLVGVVAGICVYKFVEVPVHRWSSQLRTRKSALT